MMYTVQVSCDAALVPPRVLLASLSPVSLGLVLVTCLGLVLGLGVIITRRIRREEEQEEEDMCSQSLTQPNRF